MVYRAACLNYDDSDVFDEDDIANVFDYDDAAITAITYIKEIPVQTITSCLPILLHLLLQPRLPFLSTLSIRMLHT